MIVKCAIANQNIRIDVDNDSAAAFCDSFRYDFRCEPDVLIFVTLENIKEQRELIEGISADDAAKALVLKWLSDKLVQFGKVVVLGEKVCENGKTVLRIGGDEASVYVLSEKNELFSTPWSESEPSRVLIDEIQIVGKTGELSESDWFKFMMLNTKVPQSQDNFGKYIGLIGNFYRNTKIKNGI